MQVLKPLRDALCNQIVHLAYDIQVGKKSNTPVTYRKDVPLDEAKGRVSSIWITKKGVLVVCMRSYNRITPGSRKDITPQMERRAKQDHRAYKGMPGEFQYRTFHLKGVRWIKVCRGGKWMKFDLAALEQYIQDNKAAFEQAKTAAMTAKPRKRVKRVKFSDWLDLVEASLHP